MNRIQWKQGSYTQRGTGTANEQGKKKVRKKTRITKEQKKETRKNKRKDILRKCKQGKTHKNEIRQK